MNIQEEKDARANVLEGARLLYEVVKTTLGPKGRNVMLKNKFGEFTVTHDGVTVAKSINLHDDPKTIGVELIKEASKKMDQVGDGTTSVTVLTYHLMRLASELIDKGENPMMIKRKLEGTVPYLVEQVIAKSQKVGKNYDDVLSVATISIGNEKQGKLVADLMTKVGFDGAISVEESKSGEDSTKLVEGYSFDRGYASQLFITDKGARQAVLNNPAVIVTNGVMNSLEEYENIFNVLVEQNIRNVVIIADGFEPEALGTLVLNKVRGTLNVVAIKAPGHGNAKIENFKDIVAVTGATLIDPSIGNWQAALGLNTLGAATKIIVGNDETIILGGQGDVKTRVAQCKASLKTAKEDEKEDILQRIAKISGKVGIIKVGGATETEAAEKKYRFDDAIAAVKSAMKSGIVAGGGVTLRDVAFDVLKQASSNKDKVLEALGVALCKPYEVLLENSGYDPTEEFTLGQGINVLTGERVNTLEAGIVDPAEVTCEVIRNAIATACIAITVGGAVVDKQLSTSEMTSLMNMGQ